MFCQGETTGKQAMRMLRRYPGEIINIYAIQDIVVIHHEYRVLIYRANMEKEQFVFIEEARGPVALLNPHCFAYTGFDAFGGLVVKVVRKHAEGPQLNILGFPSAFLNRYSNEILGVFWRGTQHLFLFEAGDREPCFIAMTSVGSFQPRGLYVKYGRC
uniref:DUF4915 domain-containing protein n=1 Tax=Bursaphelenchus xylophilus TaxID=6326 RepID=A0A1I7SRK7_BURXY